MMRFFRTCWLLVLFCACQTDTPEPEAPFPFQLLRQDHTGLDFRNSPTLDEKFNVFNYMYFYNGGGLAAGDFDGDGLVDLYFTSNQDANRLYLNEGDFSFRDVTETAGVKGQAGWATGATVVDINNDGRLDIYVSQVGDYLHLKGHNQLYVNQGVTDGVPIFQEQAADYGLDLVGFGTQGAFFDYDGDGDLDLYQLNHSLHQNGTFGKRENKAGEVHPLAGDRLLRNDGARFTDVTATAGITSSVVGYGLGVVTGDLNADGWPDIYVGNDFH
ncbi:MAG: VCBS repeat-containing protein, partial [Bacteroidota bacterium]